MTLFAEFPDVEWMVSQLLREDGHRAYSSIPGTPTYPLFVVARAGGPEAEKHVLDAARIQVEAWGDPDPKNKGASKAAIRTLIDRARVVVNEAAGTTVELPDATAGFISEVVVESGPIWLPDPRTARDRYVLTMVVYARSIAVVS